MGERDPERSDMVSHSIASTRPVDRMVKVVVVVGGVESCACRCGLLVRCCWSGVRLGCASGEASHVESLVPEASTGVAASIQSLKVQELVCRVSHMGISSRRLNRSSIGNYRHGDSGPDGNRLPKE
jgi:hypothetical protein